MSSKVTEVTEKVFEKYRQHGGQMYHGEAVNQLEHATQAAMRAEAEGQPTEVGIGWYIVGWYIVGWYK